ncbi:M23 family metallopeptidase [Corynebacterium urogenitale]
MKLFPLALLTALAFTLATPTPLQLSPEWIQLAAPQPSATHRLPITHPPGAEPASFVLAPADIPEENWNAGHRGVDLDAQPGDAIYASRGGTVHFAGVIAGTPVVSILHADGVRTTYEPVIRSVTKGEQIRRGQVIGHLANTATLPDTARTDPGLSWGAKIGEQYLDPMTLLGSPRVRLKTADAEPLERGAG